MASKSKTIEQGIFDLISDAKKDMVCEGYDETRYNRLDYLEKLIIGEMQASKPPQPKKPLTGIEAVLNGQQEDIDGVTGNGCSE
jgi:hypothetical protein